MMQRIVLSSLRTAPFCRNIHVTASQGFTAGSAKLYEKGRPSYDDIVLDKIISIIRSNRQTDSNIVELGAGTGKFTSSFVSYASKKAKWNTMRYTATEPSDGFRELLQLKMLPNVIVTRGLGENIPVSTNSVDAVIAAQAFHWMANVSTLQEVHRALHHQGHLIMVWNTYDYRQDWMVQIDHQILTPAYDNTTPRQQNGEWKECFATPEGIALFHPLQEFFHDSTVQRGDREMVINRIMSTSVVVEKSDAYQAQVRGKIHKVLCIRRTGGLPGAWIRLEQQARVLQKDAGLHAGIASIAHVQR
jgi:SAM-dependent methyltransferase